MRSIVFAAALLGSAVADKQSLDCPLRQVAVDYAQTLQPFRPLAAFQELADALNGAQESQNCSVAPTASASALASSSSSARVLSYALPPRGSHVVYVDAAHGSDGLASTGAAASPFQTLERALGAVRATRASAGIEAASAPRATLVLRAGTFHLPRTLELTRADSRVTFQAYPGEAVVISGGVPLAGATWTPATPPARAVWEYREGALSAGFDVLPAATMTPAAAQALCASTPACTAVAYAGTSTSTAVLVSFKYMTFYEQSKGNSVWVLNRGYLPGAANLWTADLSAFDLSADVDALRVGGVRAVRARYPNAGAAEDLGAMQIVADSWEKQPFNTSPAYTFTLPAPLRNDSADNFFQEYRLGVGGPCNVRFTPQAAYWCAEGTQGGGPGPYSAPVGLVASTASTSLPHTPYTGDVSRAAVHSWRAGRWFSWVFAVDSASFNAASNQTTFSFSITKGGNQGSRGGNAGQEFFIENVLDELDAPGEFFYDLSAKKLYLWANGTVGVAPTDVVVPQLTVLINAVGTQALPVEGVEFAGITFRDTAPNFMGPHGTPSGGDWAVGRSGAIFFEGTVGATLKGNLFTSLDGNAVFVSGYARNASIVNNEFLGIGETAISQWGYTDGSPVPGMGFDASAGNIPRGTLVQGNLVHEVGLWTKQNSFYFQSTSMETVIDSNIAYNGPRAGINFDDGLGGGSTVSNNVLANFCRESSDHGPFNSWNRVPYLVDGTTQKKNDTIFHNFILANYHSSMAIDNDDGSAYYDTHHNVLWSASSGAAYGGNSLKADFGGHDNFHHDNLDLFWSQGFGVCSTLPGHQDGYYNNMLYMAKDGNYGGGQECSGPGMTHVFGNTIWSPTGAITECGTTLAKWQASGGDPGTTASAYPADSVIIAAARSLMGLPPSSEAAAMVAR